MHAFPTPDEAPIVPPLMPWYSQLEQQMLGKAKDDDELDDEEEDEDADDTDDEDDEDDDDDLADLDEAALKEALRETRRKLEGANGSASRHRKARRDAEAKLAKSGKPAAKDDEVDADAIREAAKAEARTEADERIKRTEAKAALIAAGVSREQAADLVAFVKLADIDIDDSGDVEGLDEEVDRIKRKYPAFFGSTARKRRADVAGKGDRSGKGSGGHGKMTASQAQAARLTGRTPR